MAVVVICPSCAVRLTLTDDRAGTTFDCPKCRNVISVPAPPAPAPPPLPPPTSNPQARTEQPPSEPAGASASGSKLRFKCPACHKVYKAERADAGKEMLCKGCGAILVIPDVPATKPLHGIPLSATGYVEPETEEEPQPKTVDWSGEEPPTPGSFSPPADEPDEEDEGEDEPHKRYTPRRQRPWQVSAIGGMLIGGGVYALCYAVGYVFFATYISAYLSFVLNLPIPCCLWPLFWCVWAIIAVKRGAAILSHRRNVKNPRMLLILQLVQIINLDIVNVVLGIVGLVFLGNRRVSLSFRE